MKKWLVMSYSVCMLFDAFSWTYYNIRLKIVRFIWVRVRFLGYWHLCWRPVFDLHDWPCWTTWNRLAQVEQKILRYNSICYRIYKNPFPSPITSHRSSLPLSPLHTRRQQIQSPRRNQSPSQNRLEWYSVVCFRPIPATICILDNVKYYHLDEN